MTPNAIVARGQRIARSLADFCSPSPSSLDGANGRRRAIGAVGTVARVVVGLVLLFGVLDRAAGWIGYFGSSSAGLRPAGWVLGLVGFPAVLLTWQWLRARRSPSPFRAVGPLGHVVNAAVIVALLLTPWYAPPLAIASEAALIFYGASMLLAAVRGYGGCEVLAVSNWVLRRDDQVGCLLFAPIDHAERRFRT